MTSPAADPLDRGIALFNDRQFFEAHEVWEESWRRAEGDEARFLQGLIQVAAGFVKWQRGQTRGQADLFAKGVEKLAPFRATGRHGVDVATLIEALAAWRAAPDGPTPILHRTRA